MPQQALSLEAPPLRATDLIVAHPFERNTAWTGPCACSYAALRRTAHPQGMHYEQATGPQHMPRRQQNNPTNISTLPMVPGTSAPELRIQHPPPLPRPPLTQGTWARARTAHLPCSQAIPLLANRNAGSSGGSRSTAHTPRASAPHSATPALRVPPYTSASSTFISPPAPASASGPCGAKRRMEVLLCYLLHCMHK